MTLVVTYDDHIVWIIIPPMVEALLNEYLVFFRTTNLYLNGEVILWGRKMSVLEVVVKDLGGLGYGILGGGYLLKSDRFFSMEILYLTILSVNSCALQCIVTDCVL